MDVSLDEDDHEDAWPADYQDLRKLEKELRCPICGEFINTCLSLPDCLHSFCAVCIRRFLQTTARKEVCPMCRAPTSSALLKPNPHLDTIVRSFSNCRTSVLTALRTPAMQPVPCHSPPNKRTPSSPAAPSTSRPARVLPPRRRRTTAAVHTPIERVSILSDDEDEESAALDEDRREGDEWVRGTSDFATEPRGSSRRRRSDSSILIGGSGGPSASKRWKQEEASTPSTAAASASEPDPPGKVRCPICSIPIFESLIQRHVEGCLVHTTSTPVSCSKPSGGSGGGSALTSKAAAPAQRKLPNLVYHMMKDKTLKAHLTKANLSTKGDRKALEARHREYTLQMNCLLDTGSRVDSAKVAAEVERAERQRALAESSTASLMQQHQHSQRNPTKRSDSFAELVREVQGRKAQRSTAAAVEQPAPSTERNSTPHTQADTAPGAADPVTAPGPDKGVRASSRRGDRGLARSTENSQADDTAIAAAEIVHEARVPDHFDDDYPYELVSLSQAQPY